MTPAIAEVRRPLSASGPSVSPLCIGTAAWGVTSPDHGVTVPEETAMAAVHHLLDGPLNYLDTSNNYGGGEAERRIGRALAEYGPLPDDFVLQTKLDRDPHSGSFDSGRLRASLEESLARLGLSRVPVLLLHDPEHVGFTEAMRPGGAVETTLALRDEGLCDVVGVGGAPATMMASFVETGVFDLILTHSRFTLLDRTADALIGAAHQAGIAVLNAAVFAGGVLANYPRVSDLYAYGPGSAATLERIDLMGAACARHDVPLAAAALQFSLRDPRITSTVVGVDSPAHIDQAIARAQLTIPDELFAELEALAPAPHEWRND